MPAAVSVAGVGSARRAWQCMTSSVQPRGTGCEAVDGASEGARNTELEMVDIAPSTFRDADLKTGVQDLAQGCGWHVHR